tara:strand:+ start:419 stop:574 length:156 start_codon:yes stop_codon:yes gene_type:complete
VRDDAEEPREKKKAEEQRSVEFFSMHFLSFFFKQNSKKDSHQIFSILSSIQ